MIKILIVDDSATETALLTHIFEEHPDLKVIGCAKNGAEAIKLAPLLKPDIISMDIQMPVMDGLEATRIIMSQFPTPIVVISSKLNDGSLDVTFNALKAGALSVLAKPGNVTSTSFENEKKRITDTIRSMAEINVVRRRAKIKQTTQKAIPPSIPKSLSKPEVIGIGASVGGTQAINAILSALPATFPVPIVIVQHMMPGFISGFSSWLNANTSLHVQNAQHNDILKKGTVYFAPDNFHLEIHRQNACLTSKLIKKPPLAGFCPSITVLLQSIAKTCGKHAIGILLTGMGSDGAEGLLALKNAQGHTLIQDKESSVVFGMGGIAETLGAVDRTLRLDQFASYLIKITREDIRPNSISKGT